MKIVIANGTTEAKFVIDMFKDDPNNELVVINSSKEVVDQIVATKQIRVTHGDPWRDYILDEANITFADVFVALSNSDTDNYASCILAKRAYSVKKVICLVQNPSNVEIYRKLGIDSVVCSTYLLTENIKSESSMERLVRTLTLENNKIVVTEVPVLSNYRVCALPIAKINFPRYASIAAIYRDNTVIIPNGQVVINAKDVLLIITSPDKQSDIISFIKEKRKK
ncbi:MAG: NAD-binding protein [Bacilli bacterium]|nr:NAD-binding protein [Bacilli bacterium]